MSRLRVGLLSNPTAASGAAQRVGRQVAYLLHLAGLSVVDLSGPSAHVARARVEEVRDTLTALVVVGGDGTVALGAELVAGTGVRLGVVPAGSGNDFARALGLPVGDPPQAVRVLLHALSRPVTTIDAIEVTSGPEAPIPHRSLAIGNLSLGFDALVNARANSARFGTRTRYTTAVLRELPAFRPIPYWMEIDGQERIDVNASLLTLCNSGSFGGGMQIAPQAVLDDGLLDLVSLRGISRTELLRFLPRVYQGTHVSHPGFRVQRVRSITVGVHGSRQIRSYADGEPRALLPVTARVLPGAVRILGAHTRETEGATNPAGGAR